MIRKIILVCSIIWSEYAHAKQTLQTVWGNFEVKDPIIEELIQSRAMQRLKEVDKSGPPPYLGLMPYFSRYDHSIGVFILLNKARVSRIEQIAGLLHDTSHTVFSHLGDHIFYKAEQEKSYQDSIHLWFLKKIGIEEIIKKYNISIDQLDPDNPQYTALEQPLPLLCADRIQYNIHTGIMFNYISRDEAKQIIENLQFVDNKWFFTDPTIAKKFATISINLTSQFWGSEWNTVVYDCFYKILKCHGYWYNY